MIWLGFCMLEAIRWFMFNHSTLREVVLNEKVLFLGQHCVFFLLQSLFVGA